MLPLQVCLGFVENIEDGIAQKVTNDYILNGEYEVDIAGTRWDNILNFGIPFMYFIFYNFRYQAKVNLHSPNLPTKFPDKEREAYKATRDKHEDTLNSIVRIKKWFFFQQN